jgi:phosphonate transport system substrate-binding protein
MRGLKLALFSLSLGILLTSNANESAAETQTNGHKPAAVFTIGLVPELNLFRQVERYEPLTDFLSGKTGVKVRLKIFSRYGDVIEELSHRRLDGAFLGSLTCILAHIKSDVQIVARPVNIFGRPTYHGLIIARKDSGIRSITHMRGQRFAFVDRATTAGYIFPITFFKKYGVEDLRRYFKETYFSGTYQDAVYDVIDGKADVGAGKNTVLARLAASDGRIKNELAFIERSAEIPESCFAVSHALEGSVGRKLTDTLLNMHTGTEGINVLKEFGVQRFAATSIKDYSDIYKFVQEVGFNLEKLDHMGHR